MELKTKHEDLTMRRVLYDTLKEKRDRMKEDLAVVDDILNALVDDTAFELADVGKKKAARKKNTAAHHRNGQEYLFPNLTEEIKTVLKNGALTATDISKELQATYPQSPISNITKSVYNTIYTKLLKSESIQKVKDGTKVKYQLAQ